VQAGGEWFATFRVSLTRSGNFREKVTLAQPMAEHGTRKNLLT